ncbi:protein jagged-1a-like [Ruditapes philippinarum]|uniref:protein jagged-1a-like n=1 Tax=Ruditapes philippinarum TaxID=129788 RepID=UPI00295A8FDB|nr:protein jagged-1a-like [Ruditapes philippinarum]
MIVLMFLAVKISIISLLAVLLTNTAYTVYYKRISVNGCENDPCGNGNCSRNILGGYICYCEDGWSGTNCTEELDSCGFDPCVHDIDRCETNLCINGNCSDVNDAYICHCRPGWTGQNCSEEIDECQSEPCFHGNCTDMINTYTCQCDPGWTGSNCSEDIDECKKAPCYHGNCINLHNAYQCHCYTGWLGINCSQAVYNVALGKVTAMSSIYEGNSVLYGPHKGVDGNRNQQMYPDFSCFRNAETDEGDPWWRVDLGEVFLIQTVKIYNRLDCCSSRAKDITLSTGTSLANMLTAGIVTGQMADIEEFILPNNTAARFVQLTMNGTDPFHLCEVEVFGIQS